MSASFISTLFLSAVMFGSSSAVSPGPFSALVIGNTLNRGLKSGITTCLAPLVSDILMIIPFCYILVSQSLKIEFIYKALPFIGAFFIVYLAWSFLQAKDEESKSSGSFQQAILVNLTNPFPYLFWILVGVPYLIELESIWAKLGFVGFFYSSFILVKCSLSLLIFKGLSRRCHQLKNRLNKIISFTMIVFALQMLSYGISKF